MKAENLKAPVPSMAIGADERANLIRQRDCGPIPFAGTDDAFYERHLVFDNVIELAAAGARAF